MMHLMDIVLFLMLFPLINQDSIVRVVTRLWIGQLIVAFLNGFRICSFFLLSSLYFMQCVCVRSLHMEDWIIMSLMSCMAC